MPFKRVVTAVQEDGRSVFAEESIVQPFAPAMMGGSAYHLMWSTEGAVTAPVALAESGATGTTFFPGPGGTRFGTVTFPPQQRDAPPPEPVDDETAAERLAEVEAGLPQMLSFMEPDSPGMHTTPTLDYIVVTAGTFTLELDDGAEVELPTGSCVIQQGTRHAWHNYGAEPATFAFTIVGAETAIGE